mmetsp:Transcript_74461/g.125377  ORF Transcript_74461/g.125377 Transcript_74461/m.125377 type:complete len:273 (+) Transcript_74461:827-1645(+)
MKLLAPHPSTAPSTSVKSTAAESQAGRTDTPGMQCVYQSVCISVVADVGPLFVCRPLVEQTGAPAIHHKVVAVHKAAVLACQEHCSSSHILRHPRPGQWRRMGERVHQLCHLLGVGLIGHLRRLRRAAPEDWRCDRPRRNAVDPNATGAQLHSCELREVRDCGLGGGVQEISLVVPQRGDAGIVDDAAAGVAHVSRCMFDAKDHAPDQQPHGIVELVLRDAVHRGKGGRPGVVEHAVQPPELGHREVAERRDVGLEAHVARLEARVRAQGGR